MYTEVYYICKIAASVSFCVYDCIYTCFQLFDVPSEQVIHNQHASY